MTLPMKIKRLAPWPGGKATLAGRIVAEGGPHDEFHEDFTGGCSIIFAKPRSAVERLNDANPKIINVLTCLRDFPHTIQAALEDTPFERDSWECAKAELLSGGLIGARAAAAQLAVWWMGASGFAGTTKQGWFAQRHSKTGGDPSVRWESLKSSLPAQSERLQGCDFSCMDFREFNKTVPDRKGVLRYVDSPYLSKKIRYEYDFADADHDCLAECLNRFRHTRIIVSYRAENDAERVRLSSLYPPDRWRRVEIEMSKNMASASGTAKRNTEVLLINDVKGGA